ncbi:Rpn family recombination-promoting nuclease/putative transposase [Treponema sp. R80B11-R83G3]
MENANEKHKDTVFTFLFSNPALLRELYSAIKGVTLPPDVPIDINTLQDVLFRRQRNDISFLIDNRLIVLIEHQSTINDNMPLRCLMYVEKLYEVITDTEDKFKRRLEKIPKPEFIVLYNGADPYPDYKELKLSDAFMKTDTIKIDSPLELVVQVYNINKGRNQGILGKSRTLENYSQFIDKIREYQKEYQWKYPDKKKLLDKAFRSAINYCIKNNILKDFLRKHGSEVLNMLYSEYDPEVEMRVVREETRDEAEEYFIELLDQDLTKEEIKKRLQEKKRILNEALF